MKRIEVLREVDDRVPIRRVDLKTGGAFLLYNVLSPKECQYYIEKTEELGYGSIEGEYHPKYRKNDRVIVASVELARLIFERVRPFLPPAMETDFDVHGCNEVFRFCRYDPGGHFAPHYDACFARNTNERSFLTLNFYLNGGFEGGKTCFLKSRNNPTQTVDEVVPEAGLCLVFPHERLHRGDVLLSGRKYIMRTDAMYLRRGAKPVPLTPSSAESEVDDAFLQGAALLAEAEKLEAAGRLDEAVAAYRRAYRLCPRLDPTMKTGVGSAAAAAASGL